jgi:ribonuclease E
MPRDVARIVTDREEVATRIRALLAAWYGPGPEPEPAVAPGPAPEPGSETAADDGPETAEPGAVPEVLVHGDLMPLFHAYGAEPQLEEAFRRVLRLPSGGSVVIDPTEALVSIDVNSGRSTDEKDPDATALQTNLEAVEVIARQLRLRDLGGLVVVDLIDMRERKNGRAVERAFKKALARDRARIRLGRIGPFGCITLSRQRIRQALSRVTHEECPECGGTGRRRHPEGLGLRVLREMRARVARAHGRGGLEARVPKGVHDWIQRHRGRVLRELEKVCSGPVRLTVDDRLALDGWAMKGLPPAGKARKG